MGSFFRLCCNVMSCVSLCYVCLMFQKCFLHVRGFRPPPLALTSPVCHPVLVDCVDIYTFWHDTETAHRWYDTMMVSYYTDFSSGGGSALLFTCLSDDPINSHIAFSFHSAFSLDKRKKSKPDLISVPMADGRCVKPRSAGTPHPATAQWGTGAGSRPVKGGNGTGHSLQPGIAQCALKPRTSNGWPIKFHLTL